MILFSIDDVISVKCTMYFVCFRIVDHECSMFGYDKSISVDGCKQVFSIMFYLTFFLVAGPFTLTCLLYLLFWSNFWWLSVLYGVWWVWDVQTCNTGSNNQYQH